MSEVGAKVHLAPWDDEAIAALFAELKGAVALVVAVSGGPDSLALLHLVTRWASSRSAASPAPLLYVATVDHGLRAEGAVEAAFVADVCATLGYPHATLVWRGPKPTTRIQERARAARYALLADHARFVGAAHILTAHHADDQAETVLMQLGRGSGLAGLAGMRRTTALRPGLNLVRPLLDVPKSALVSVCRRAEQDFVSDPSNVDPTYARVRVRAQAATVARLGLDRPALLRLARRMARAEAALDAETSRLEALLAPNRTAGLWRATLGPARPITPEILGRVLRRAIVQVGGAPEPRLERLETLADALHAALTAGLPHRSTLGRVCVILEPDATLTLYPEGERRRGRRRPSMAANRHG